MKNILYITVLPQTQHTAKFIINDNTEVHVKKLNDLLNYLIELVDEKTLIPKLDELIWSFQAFLIDIKNKTITELSFDKTKEIKELKKNSRNPSINSLIKRKPLTKLDTFKTYGFKNIF